MKETGITFTGESPRAILEGRKTQTRRVRGLEDVNKNPASWELHRLGALDYMTRKPFKGRFGATFHSTKIEPRTLSVCPQVCPYGQPGDRLWVRHAFWFYESTGANPGNRHVWDEFTRVSRWRSGEIAKDVEPDTGEGSLYVRKRSIHMARWASRITLEILKVRVERVQDISEEDAKAEGIKLISGHKWCPPGKLPPLESDEWKTVTYKMGFEWLWDSINAKRGFSWGVNPWVWVIEFKKVTA